MKQKFVNHRGWELDSFDTSYPVANNGNIYINVTEDTNVVSVEGIGNDSIPIEFKVPLVVLRAWLQEYEKQEALINEPRISPNNHE